jgi:phage tail-like protein
MTWNFYGAIPVKWSVSSFNAMESKIAIETIEFKYNRMTVEG